MSRRRVVVIGDVLLDRDLNGDVKRLCPDAPVPVVDVLQTWGSPGGAGLAALLCRHDPESVDVRLVTPLADDEAGRAILTRLDGIDVVALEQTGSTRRKSRVRAADQSLLRIDDGGPATPRNVDPHVIDRALRDADVVLVADYGGGVTHDPVIRDRLAEAATWIKVVWDPHPRGGAPVPGVTLVTPNETEARQVLGDSVSPPDTLAVDVRQVWAAEAVAMTAGARGAFLAIGDAALYAPVEPIDQPRDPCGAGDSFAASASVALAYGASTSEAVLRAARDARAWVARGGLVGFRQVLRRPILTEHTGADEPEPAGLGVVSRIRRHGGTLVATGGCFDVLHAGHIATLESGRRLGDGLVVLLNSDDSVRRLKGAGRPAVGQQDRQRMLLALRSVDAVIVFDDRTPAEALAELKPDIWVKGGDYVSRELPEAELVRSWGGRVILLPYLQGRSTTALLTGRPHG